MKRELQSSLRQLKRSEDAVAQKKFQNEPPERRVFAQFRKDVTGQPVTDPNPRSMYELGQRSISQHFPVYDAQQARAANLPAMVKAAQEKGDAVLAQDPECGVGPRADESMGLAQADAPHSPMQQASPGSVCAEGGADGWGSCHAAGGVVEVKAANRHSDLSHERPRSCNPRSRSPRSRSPRSRSPRSRGLRSCSPRCRSPQKPQSTSRSPRAAASEEQPRAAAPSCSLEPAPVRSPRASATPVVAVKAICGQCIRRFGISTSDFDELERRVQDLFDPRGPFVLTFKDDDGDLVTMSTDAELQEAIRIANLHEPAVLRLQITADQMVDAMVVSHPLNNQGLVPWTDRQHWCSLL